MSRRHPRALVIGADQILVCGGEWFDKPTDIRTPRALSCRRCAAGRHLLATAACAVCGGERLWHHACVAGTDDARLQRRFLDGYIAAEGEAILGSVGAYRLEARGVQLFERIEGDHFAILGLPLVELLGFLREYGALVELT